MSYQSPRSLSRRALTADETKLYSNLVKDFANTADGVNNLDGFWSALNIAFRAILNSPDFLYRMEIGTPVNAAQPAVVRLSNYEVATRLAFFIWNSPPDDQLLTATESGNLGTVAQLRSQAERLLADPKGQNGVKNLYLQLLGLKGLSGNAKSTTAFPSLPSDQKTVTDAALQETMTFVSNVILAGDGKFETLMTAPYGYPSGPLFSLYNVTQPAGFQPGTQVAYNPQQRSGLLTQEAILWNLSHSDQTEPVQRGKLVLTKFLCEVIPPPPPNVNQTPPPHDVGATARIRFYQHEADPNCGGCHKRMDSIGLAFENYDATGAFRTTDNGNALDLTGKFTGTLSTNVAFNGLIDITRTLAASVDAQNCASLQYLRYALQRTEADQDQCSVSSIQQQFQASGHNLKELMLSVISSDAFLYRNNDPT